MATKIGASVIENSKAASGSFTPGGPFKVLTKKGVVRLVEAIDGSDYVVAQALPLAADRTQEAKEVLIAKGNVLYVNPLDATAVFKLTPVGDDATAEAWLV